MIDAFVSFIELCLEPWPSWAQRWYGWLARLLIVAIGGMIGLLAIVLAGWGDPLGTGGIIVRFTGVATILVSLLVALRPTKGTVLLAGLDVVWWFILSNMK